MKLKLIPPLLLAILMLSTGFTPLAGAYGVAEPSGENIHLKVKAQVMVQVCEKAELRLRELMEDYNITLPSDLAEARQEALQLIEQAREALEQGLYQVALEKALDAVRELRPLIRFVMNLTAPPDVESQVVRFRLNNTLHLQLRFLEKIKSMLNASLHFNVTIPHVNVSEVKEKILEAIEQLKLGNLTNATKLFNEAKEMVRELIGKIRNATDKIILPIRIELLVSRFTERHIAKIQSVAEMLLNRTSTAEEAIENATERISSAVAKLEELLEIAEARCRPAVEGISRAIEALNNTLTRLNAIKKALHELNPEELVDYVTDLVSTAGSTASGIVEHMTYHQAREAVQHAANQVQEWIHNVLHRGHGGRSP